MIMKTTMKSAMKAAALLLMATVMTAGMTSCSNDDDNNSGTVTDTTVAGTVITITPSLSDDCANYDNSLVYTDGAGVKHTETLTNGKAITIKSNTPESTGKLTIHQTVKAGVKLTEASYMYGAELSFVVEGVNAKGQLVCKSNVQKANLQYTVKANQLVETLAKDPMKGQYRITKTTDPENPLLFVVERIVEQ